jgi:hypothetical protein
MVQSQLRIRSEGVGNRARLARNGTKVHGTTGMTYAVGQSDEADNFAQATTRMADHEDDCSDHPTVEQQKSSWMESSWQIFSLCIRLNRPPGAECSGGSGMHLPKRNLILPGWCKQRRQVFEEVSWLCRLDLKEEEAVNRDALIVLLFCISTNLCFHLCPHPNPPFVVSS